MFDLNPFVLPPPLSPNHFPSLIDFIWLLPPLPKVPASLSGPVLPSGNCGLKFDFFPFFFFYRETTVFFPFCRKALPENILLLFSLYYAWPHLYSKYRLPVYPSIRPVAAVLRIVFYFFSSAPPPPPPRLASLNWETSCGDERGRPLQVRSPLVPYSLHALHVVAFVQQSRSLNR